MLTQGITKMSRCALVRTAYDVHDSFSSILVYDQINLREAVALSRLKSYILYSDRSDLIRNGITDRHIKCHPASYHGISRFLSSHNISAVTDNKQRWSMTQYYTWNSRPYLLKTVGGNQPLHFGWYSPWQVSLTVSSPVTHLQCPTIGHSWLNDNGSKWFPIFQSLEFCSPVFFDPCFASQTGKNCVKMVK